MQIKNLSEYFSSFLDDTDQFKTVDISGNFKFINTVHGKANRYKNLSETELSIK
jgi:hypothetical protein